ncbi:purine-nucleoside phosphorylase [Cesiribacter andamanensis]|uniref:Purine nucleoside phosphorylase n=1 Tax=Cesiribacter andamanensis AMV16 TaxID=1279009 RepID=M7N8K7_9BACT|nr:purine-nucleoside phosphorylase [Cesiribacter andamanensis]EMR03551.1 Purine nucleoside phosphorylase 1 [Cesiribacter andamanensis AMV16]
MQTQIHEAVAAIRRITDATPHIGIILGTGLGQLVNKVSIQHRIPYTDIPHFPAATVESHQGYLIFGQLGGKPVVVMQGRFHYYEGYSMQQITLPVRVMKLLGIRKLFISNAAGGLNPDYQLSDLMALNDHINLLPENPLRGPNMNDFGPRFPDMYKPYDETLLEQAGQLAETLGFPLRKGVYASVTGPNLETPAEYRYLRIIGADAVGMSTVPEALVARHMNLPVFAVSVITDMGTPEGVEHVTLEKVLAAAAQAEPKLTALIEALVATQTED